MRSSYIALGLMSFSFGLVMLSAPHLWFYAGINLLLAFLLTMKDNIIRRQQAKIHFQSVLLDCAKVLMEAKDRAAKAEKKEGVGPWG